MGNVKIWLNVPDGSTFEASASGTTDNWSILVDIDSDTGEETEWTRDDLDPGPATMTVRSPHTYTGRVDIEVVGDAPAAVTFTGKIVKPDGTTYQQPLSITTPAAEGSYLATIGIVMEK
jgi:hypothetical protein